jgi:hypothetical protein
MTILQPILRLCCLVQLMLLVTLIAPHIYAAEYSCTSGDVTCLIASINDANTLPGQHIINLEPGNYTLHAIDNEVSLNANGLPVITSSVQITPVADDLPTVIQRDAGAPFFRIFSVSPGGELILDGLTVQGGGFVISPAILNGGITSLNNSVVTNSRGELGAIHNTGTLKVLTSIIVDNFGGHDGGGIVNVGGSVLVENSTIAHNSGIGPGGISNFGGSIRVRNSAIISNTTDEAQPGGGIGNFLGSVEIINTTIAKNLAGVQGGGGVYNSGGGLVSITNSTIRENEVFRSTSLGGAGIRNDASDSLSGATVQIKNTIIAGNTLRFGFSFGPNCRGPITTLGNNLVGDPSDCDINLQPTDLTGDPGLGDLVQMGEDDQPGKAFYPVMPGSVVISRGDPDACPVKDQLGNTRVGACDIGAIEFQERTQVAIDIRPRSDADKVNPRSTKSINVAVISENGFDADTLDFGTVRFGASGTEAAPVHVAHRDVNRDGQRDLVLRFQIQELGVECGATSLSLTGQLVDGQPIIGSAPITTTGCKKKNAQRE